MPRHKIDNYLAKKGIDANIPHTKNGFTLDFLKFGCLQTPKLHLEATMLKNGLD